MESNHQQTKYCACLNDRVIRLLILHTKTKQTIALAAFSKWAGSRLNEPLPLGI